MSNATDAQKGAPNGLPASPTLLYALLAVLAVGIGVALYLIRLKLQLETGLADAAACNFGGKVSCDPVITSEYGSVFGQPIALYALPTYAMMGFLVWQAFGAIGASSDEARAKGALALQGVAALGAATVLHSMYLAYISSAVLGFYCAYCMTLYVVNISATVLAIAAGPKTIGNAISGAIDGIKGVQPPVGQAVAVAAVVGLVGWVGTDHFKAVWEKDGVVLQICKTDADCAPHIEACGRDPHCAWAKSGKPEPAVEGTAVAVAPAPNQQPSAGAATAVAEVAPPVGKDCGDGPDYDPANARIAGQETKEDGWTEVHYPIDEDCDFFYGNPKAKVTFVKVADFQCPYCRYLAMTLDPIMKEYKDRVRFVMRHFPMNGRCNPRMSGYDKHPNACEASWAAHCAGLQGKFWEMHDHLYANQQALDEYNLDKHAQTLGLDIAKFRVCMKDPKTDAHVKKDIQIAYKGAIYGTPKAYINGRLVTGSGSKAIFKYHLDLALKEAEGGAPVAAAAGGNEAVAPKGDGTQMIEGKTASKTFYIDPFEASLGKDGKAYSKPGVKPARVAWATAKAACDKAGKRLCTEEEWVSACTGTPAVDNNNNAQFADDDVEGKMYPYGAFYQANTCFDQGDKYQGNPVATGSHDQCRTPSGVFDLAGNISEWVGDTKETATLLGGHAASGEGARCNDRAFTPGIGRRNQTTGFRCCADSNVTSTPVQEAALEPVLETYKGQMVPDFEATDSEGKTVRSRDFKGRVTLLNFFASWCGPCKKEFPYLVKYDEEMRSKGLQIIGVGVDNEASASIEFVKGYNAAFRIITDPDSILMGTMMVYSMPSTFLIDKDGRIVYTHTGFKPEEDEAPLKAAIQKLL